MDILLLIGAWVIAVILLDWFRPVINSQQAAILAIRHHDYRQIIATFLCFPFTPFSSLRVLRAIRGVRRTKLWIR